MVINILEVTSLDVNYMTNDIQPVGIGIYSLIEVKLVILCGRSDLKRICTLFKCLFMTIFVLFLVMINGGTYFLFLVVSVILPLTSFLYRTPHFRGKQFKCGTTLTITVRCVYLYPLVLTSYMPLSVNIIQL